MQLCCTDNIYSSKSKKCKKKLFLNTIILFLSPQGSGRYKYRGKDVKIQKLRKTFLNFYKIGKVIIISATLILGSMYNKLHLKMTSHFYKINFRNSKFPH